jgi:hypothetical protein
MGMINALDYDDLHRDKGIEEKNNNRKLLALLRTALEAWKRISKGLPKQRTLLTIGLIQ